MSKVFGVAIRKGGQGKSTTVSTVARLCALSGARVLVVDLAQPGTTTASLRDIWRPWDHTDVSETLLALRSVPAQVTPSLEQARAALSASGLPVALASQPSWAGGSIRIFPWDEALADAATFVRSEFVLAALIRALADEIDLALIDFPAEGGSLYAMAMAVTERIIMPLAPETPALEGAYSTLRSIAQWKARDHPIALGGIILTRCDPKNKRMFDVVQALLQTTEIEGELVSERLFPFGIRVNEFFEHAFRYGEPVWERSANPSHWAGYVLLAEWLLTRAGRGDLAQPSRRRGPAILTADTRVLDVTAGALESPETPYADFARTHPPSR
jgi:cellulose biosynthesis protein BcsQ